MKRKIFITLILTILSVLMLGALSVSAATYGDLTYTVSGNEVTITDCSSTATSVTIPSEIGGKPVTTIGYQAFYNCTGLTSVTIPDSVTTIGESAFYNCTGLTRVTIPDSVTSIGSSAFYGCAGLTSVTIPDSVTTIGYKAFSGCTGLTNVTIPDSVTSIGNFAFSGCRGLTSVTIPDSVTTIGDYAFNGCKGLTSVTIPDSVTSIGSEAFYYCTGLTKVNITSIEAWCNITFDYSNANPLCYAGNLYLDDNKVTDLVIPTGVTTIEWYAFYNCTGLTSVTIPDSVTSIGNCAFYNCTGLTRVTIPDSVTTIGNSAFSECTGLTSVTIPDSVSSIGNCAFYNCTGLTKVNITSIEAWCNVSFEKDYSNPLEYAKRLYLDDELITDLVIPDSVTSIGSSAFYNCTGLTSVTIPDSVISIGSSAFYYCTGLTKVNITSIEAWCNITFDSYDANPLYYAGNLYHDDNKVADLVIPTGVTTIESRAFYGCTGLTSVTIPDSVTSIGSSAFDGCTGLTSVTIPDSVISIGNNAFYNCRGLTSVTISDSVTTIGDYAFRGCTGLTSVTIGEGVELIPENAFYGCGSLDTVCLSDNVLYIRNDAFNGCSDLTTVFYAGDEKDWNEILFYNRNENLTNAKIIYNATQKTYSFVTNCDEELADVTGYAVFNAPMVDNEGSTLVGWYDNEELSGNPVTFPYYGDNTTLYASWADKTGASFDDALTIRVNQEYTVTTTTSGQLVYFEFVPKKTKEYKFYSTGNKDTYGYLYNSNKSQLKSNDDDGEGYNFYISYNLIAGQTYYLSAKVYNGSGTFTVKVEEPIDYRINHITIKDVAGNSLDAIPTGTFLATVSFTNVSASGDTVIILAQYNHKGTFKGQMYIQTEDVPSGSTIKLSIPVDNTKGDVAKLKAFCWSNFGSLMPMGNSVTYPAE